MRQPDRPELLPPRRWHQALALLALLAGAVYLGWRWGWTLRFGTLWLGLPLVIAETWALTAVALFVFSAWRLTVRRPPAPSVGTRVAILVPTYNEPPDVLRATVLGAISVRHDPTPEVWILDDGARAWVRELSRELGTRYLVRPTPREHAKAGNLNNALGLLDAELLLVLDADHVPLPHFLERTIGYFDDPDVAFVQAPQAFFNRSFQHPREHEDPILNEQSLFYDVICRGKDRDNAVFWCGSSAVLRRSALESVGGVATNTVVEDTHTAMKLHQAGWRSVYHFEVLAVGLAPEEVTAFLTQRGRWARGCYQILGHDNPLLARGLRWRQRLHYFSSVSHYLEGPQRLIGLLVPPLVLLTGTIPLAAPAVLYLTLFLPQLVLVPLATRALARGRYSFRESERYALIRVATYTRAADALFRQGRVTFKVTPKGADSRGRAWTGAVKLPVALAMFALAGVIYQTLAQILDLPGRLTLFAYVVTVVWGLLSAGFLWIVVWWTSSVRHRRAAHRFPVRLQATFGTDETAPPSEQALVEDLNPFGLAMQVARPLQSGARVRIALLLETGPVDIRGAVARADASPDGSSRIGVRFDELPQATQDAITRWCFAQPFGPDYGVRSTQSQLPLEPVPVGEAERV
jgi:cellulose synthase/poly-beta-1,6-N-acetylglucosamine synthase-like glycosyltransferase